MKKPIGKRRLKCMAGLLLSILLVLSLAGCGCGKKNTDSKSKSETETVSGSSLDTDSQDTATDSQDTDGTGTEDASDDSGSTLDTTLDTAEEDTASDSSQVVSANTMEVTSQTPKSGEEFEVVVQAGENTPVAAYTIELSYDSTLLQVVEYGRTEAFEAAYTGICAENDKGGTIVFAGVNANQHQQYYTGDMLYVKFKAVGAAGSTADVTLNVVETVPYDGGNTAGNFTAKSGTVTIK
jgi:hypothetical protein